jgi:hypothetical protein
MYLPFIERYEYMRTVQDDTSYTNPIKLSGLDKHGFALRSELRSNTKIAR